MGDMRYYMRKYAYHRRPRQANSTSPLGTTHVLTLPPERGCPQPQHVRKGLGPGTLGRRCVAGAAAAGNSRAPAASRRLKAPAATSCTARNLLRQPVETEGAAA